VLKTSDHTTIVSRAQGTDSAGDSLPRADVLVVGGQLSVVGELPREIATTTDHRQPTTH
jgi:hypothetical protein